MRHVIIPANYYQNFNADYLLEFPAEGYGGWKKTGLKFDLDELAVVVMHAWDCSSYGKYPGWYRVAEWLPRAKRICQMYLPELLTTVRDRNIRLFHVASDESYCHMLPGYKRTLELMAQEHAVCSNSISNSFSAKRLEPSSILEDLNNFRMKNCSYGLHNRQDIEDGFENLDFAPEAKPLDSEEIAVSSDQLVTLCRTYGINHLVYTGFNINWCLHTSPCGMVDMNRNGFMCSTIRQAVTAVENKETARHEICKEIALWRVALEYGFVFNIDDFIASVK